MHCILSCGNHTGYIILLIEVEGYREKVRQEYIHSIHHMHCILSCGNHTGYIILLIEVEVYREKFEHD